VIERRAVLAFDGCSRGPLDAGGALPEEPPQALEIARQSVTAIADASTDGDHLIGRTVGDGVAGTCRAVGDRSRSG
jgi:hypothetical protein